MNYKVVVDPGHGGNDSGVSGNGLVEKDFSLLVSNYIKERLDQLGISNIITRNTDRNLSDSERVSVINSFLGNSKNAIVISNHLNKGGESGLEIVYPLKDNDKLAATIASQADLDGLIVNKYYQLRDPVNTAKDYYSIIRDTPNYKTVLINYGYVDNSSDAKKLKNNYKDYAETVVHAIANYVGVPYFPIDKDYYIVQKGDTLYKIANTFGVTVDSLKRANNLKNNILNIGQVLVIPGSINDDKDTYIVKSGDTLYKIANTFGITVDSLKKENNLTSNLLSIGQVLKIPSSKKTYTVKSGDTLYKIASTFGITVDSLKKENNLTSNLLSIGQELVIPS